MAAAHAFVADVEAPELATEDRHHLERVLRLRPGEQLTVSDGAGRWRLCRFATELELAGPVQVEPRPEPEITVALALTKGERLEWAVQKLTELGVDRIVPLAAARSVVRWDGDRGVAHVDRLRRVARQAAMQSRRVRLPVVAGVHDFATAASLPGAAMAERGGHPPTLATPVVLVGPEGGWDEAELAAPLPTVGLGPHVLRAETAAVAAAALLTALRAGLVTPPS
ncbi:MAG TPA: RsmE family RNA methyltransferase [Acidimicrobiia bacterium]|nr:RsmE family RNA methyltransferase [Acidimicrobiia bacterium]